MILILPVTGHINFDNVDSTLWHICNEKNKTKTPVSLKKVLNEAVKIIFLYLDHGTSF